MLGPACPIVEKQSSSLIDVELAGTGADCDSWVSGLPVDHCSIAEYIVDANPDWLSCLESLVHVKAGWRLEGSPQSEDSVRVSAGRKLGRRREGGNPHLGNPVRVNIGCQLGLRQEEGNPQERNSLLVNAVGKGKPCAVLCASGPRQPALGQSTQLLYKICCQVFLARQSFSLP